MSPSFPLRRRPVTVRDLCGERTDEGATDRGYVFLNGRCPFCENLKKFCECRERGEEP